MSQRDITRFQIGCFYCKAQFDVFDATWCECIVRDSSIICPACMRCFCKVPQDYKREFWRNAPPLLVQRRMKELRDDFKPEGKPEAALPVRDAADAPLILIVDDSRTVRLIACTIANDAGYRVIEAPNAVDALNLIHEQRPALVISDALMPKMDGREMCRMIKNDPRTAGTKVVLMTGLYTGTRYKTEAMNTFGADDYLNKPVQPEQLNALLQRFAPLQETRCA